MTERRCPCIRCESLRLAIRVFLAAIVVLFLFAFLHRNDGRGRITIETVPSERTMR